MQSRSHHFLQQTCAFIWEEDQQTPCAEDLEGQPLAQLCWNATGKLLAAAVNSSLNIWAIAGKGEITSRGVYIVFLHHIFLNKEFKIC